MTKSLFLALTATSCLIPAAAHAEEQMELPTLHVEDSEDASAHSPTVLTQDRSDWRQGQSNSSDTARLLTRLPGVSANEGGGFSAMPVIRGLNEQRLNILVDGHPIDTACPNDMNTPLSYTAPQTVHSARVLTGIAPVSLGGDSIGGAIVVETTPPRFSTDDRMLVTGELSHYYRSNGDGFGGGGRLTVASRSWSLSYAGSYSLAGNYQGGGSKGEVHSTEYAKTDHQLAAAVQTALGLFEVKGGFQFSPYEGFANQRMDMTSNKSWFLSGRYRGFFDWGDIDLGAQYRDTDHRMNFLDDKRGATNRAMPMNTEVHSASVNLKTGLAISDAHRLVLGGEYHHQWMDDYWPPVPGNMMMGPGTFVNINGATRDRIGAFAEWEAQWAGGLSSVAGIRFDRVRMNTGDVQPYGVSMMQMDDIMAAAAFNARDHRRTDSNWSGSVQLSYAASDMLKLELGYAHKARSPNLYERYSWGRGAMASQMIGWYGDGNGYVGNLDLKPERADTVSAGVTLGSGGEHGWSLSLSPYYTRVRDYIDAVKLRDLTNMMGMPSGFVQLQFANEDAEFYGVDMTAHLPLMQETPAGSASLHATASWLHGQNLSDRQPVYHQMPFNASLALDHALDGWSNRVELTYVADKNRVDPVRKEPRTDSYMLVNMRTAYDAGLVTVSLDVENLFDKGYDLPLGGMSLGDLNVNNILRPVPGRGRSFNVGVSMSF